MEFPSAIRLIIDGPASGSWNMAVDEVLLESAQQGLATLRFYRWTPATLSLGYFQAHGDRQQHPASGECSIVRRTTGGGAILHDQELTYSITLPCRKRFSNSPESIYDALHNSLVQALSLLGVCATRCQQSDPTREANFLCFERRARGDVIVEGFKIAGSAQRRYAGALLQHGSVLLAASEYASELPGLRELSQLTIGVPELVNEWIRTIKMAFGSRFSLNSLSPAEVSRAKEVAATRHANESWIGRR